ncbi:MAG TPA: hypothetical protein VG759_27465 [Candidatus Angelobacter sp.]|jgi:hypothetical protein|nr:hypothetical protein [Candidatus Angelobacter sp.]
MKTKNKRELEKYWAQAAAKKAKLVKKETNSGENSKPTTESTDKGTKK